MMGYGIKTNDGCMRATTDDGGTRVTTDDRGIERIIP